MFTANAEHILKARYFAPGETEQGFIDRISLGDRRYRENLIEPLFFLPNSPTLFNVGIEGAGTLSACFKFDVDDTLLEGPNSIMSTMFKAAAVTKWGGGVGYYVGAIRPRGSEVNSTHGSALGPLGVLRMYNGVAKELTQSGRRNAAQMGILPVSHPDILDFIHMKDEDPQSLATFNISVAITNDFMKEATSGETRERGILRAMAESAWRTGDPGVFFVDRVERDNPTPHLGALTGTNPCGEVPLLNNEACNLGSINVARFVKMNGYGSRGQFDWVGLANTVDLAIEYLDEIVSLNTFPHEAIADAVAATRKVGLGVCGVADALALMRIHYDTPEAAEFEATLARRMRSTAERTSMRLADLKGAYPASKTGKRRNATVLCYAPTGTISILMDASGGIEPHYALQWDRRLEDGTILGEKIATFRQTDFVPKTAMEIPWQSHVDHQMAAQAFVDLAVSKTINMPNEATVDDVFNAYIALWESGCKGGTIFRDGCRNEQVLTATGGVAADVCDDCGTALVHTEGCVECPTCQWSACAT